MHIQRLQELINEPGKTLLSDRDGLSDWVKKYPYAGAFSMLLARSSAVGGHIEQQVDLMRAAASSSLRQPLFDLILRTKLLEEAREIHAQIEAAPEVPEAEWAGHEEPALVAPADLESPEISGLMGFRRSSSVNRDNQRGGRNEVEKCSVKSIFGLVNGASLGNRIW